MCFVCEDAPNNELESSSAGKIGASDLLIVGPGVLGRIIAEEWRKVFQHQILFDEYFCLLDETRRDLYNRVSFNCSICISI